MSRFAFLLLVALPTTAVCEDLIYVLPKNVEDVKLPDGYCTQDKGPQTVSVVRTNAKDVYKFNSDKSKCLNGATPPPDKVWVLDQDEIASDQFSLEWKPEPEPRKLTVKLKPKLGQTKINTKEALEKTELSVVGIPTISNPEAKWDCPSEGSCSYTVEAEKSWSLYPSVTLRLIPRQGSAFFNENGELLKQWDVEHVGKWESLSGADLVAVVNLSLQDTRVESGAVDVPLVSPYARLFPTDQKLACIGLDAKGSVITELKDVKSCAQIIEMGDDLVLELKSDAVKKLKEKSATSIQITIRFKEDTTLNGRSTATLRIFFKECQFDFTQLTPLYVGLSDQDLYFRASTVTPECRAYLRDAQLKANVVGTGSLGVDVRSVNGELLKFHFAPKADAKLRGLQLEIRDSNGNLLHTENGGPALLVEDEPVIRGPKIKVFPKLPSRFKSLQLASNGLAVGRDNQLTFAAAQIDHWTFTIQSPEVQPCDGSARTVKADKNSSICLHSYLPTEASTKLRLLAVFYQTREDLQYWQGLHGVSVSADLLGRIIHDKSINIVDDKSINIVDDKSIKGKPSFRMGSKDLAQDGDPILSKDFRLALNLESRMHVNCPGQENYWLNPGQVDSSAYSGTRAVAFEQLDDCSVHLDLRDLLTNGHLLKEQDVQNFFADYGRQRIKIKIEVFGTPSTATGTGNLVAAPSGGSPSATSTPTSPIEDHFVLSSEMNFPSEGKGILLLDKEGALRIPIHLRRNNNFDVPEYGIVRVTAAHENKEDYIAENAFPELGEVSKPTSEMVAELRRMPEILAARLPNWLKNLKVGGVQALSLTPGFGFRVYATFNLPTGLLRSPNLSEVTASSSYQKLEPIALGTGALGVFEFWDFDHDRAPAWFNPQYHLGFFISELPKANGLLPRLSIVTGLGLRVPSSINLQRDSPVRAVIWVEWSRRVEEPSWRQALLFGFAINLGSIPN